MVVGLLICWGALFASDEKEEVPATQRPVLSPSADSNDTIEALHKHRLYTIGVLEDFVRKYPKSDELSNIYYELGSNYYEEARYNEIKALEKGAAEKDRKFLQATSDRLKMKAALTFEKLVERFPNHEHMASILYALADTYTALGKQEKAAHYFREITERFPTSPEAAHAHLMVADSYFESNRFSTALESYQKVLTKTSDSKALFYARFRIAWCLFNLGRHGQSLEGFKDVILKGRKYEGEARKSYFYDEALLDIVNPFAESRQAGEAKSYFSSFLSDGELKDVLYRLATLYHHHGKYSGAEVLLAELYSMHPNDPDVATWLKKLVEVYAAQGKKDKILSTITTLKRVSAEKESSSTDKIEGGDESERLLRKLAADSHKRAQRSKKPKDYEDAVAYYQAVVTLFPEEPKIFEVRFFLAEALYGAQRFDQAFHEYEKVKNDPAGTGNYRKDAISAMIAIREKESPVFKSALEKPKARVQSVDQIPEGERELITLYEEQLPAAQGEAAAANIRFKIGSIYYYYGLFADAESNLEKVAASAAKPALSKTAANLILNIHTVKGDYAELAETARRLKNTAGGDVEFRQDMGKVEQKALFKTIEKIERQGQYLDAAQKYEAFTRAYPSSSFSDKAYYNAILNYMRAGDHDSAMRVRSEMARTQKGSPLLKKAHSLIAKQLAAIGEYQKAAVAFSSFAREYPSDVTGAQAAYNAIIFKRALGDYNGAIADSQFYLSQFRGGRHWDEVNFNLIYVFKDAGRTQDAIRHVERFIASHSSLDLSYFKARLLKAELLEGESRLREFEAILARYRQARVKNREIGAIVAEALFVVIQETTHERFSEVEFSQGNLEAATKRKLALLDQLKNGYTDVIKLGEGRWGIAALVKLGDAYAQFGNALLDAPIPSNLTESQAEQYRAMLRKQTKEILEKAKEAYQRAVAKSFELQIYSEWIELAGKQLKTFNVAPYPEVDGADAGADPDRLSEAETMSLDGAKAILIKTPTAAAMNTLGNSFYRGGLFKLAELTYSIGVKLFPKYAAFYNNLGLCAYKTGDMDAAIAYWNKAVGRSYKMNEARYNLAAVARRFHDQKSARNQLQRISELKGG